MGNMATSTGSFSRKRFGSPLKQLLRRVGRGVGLDVHKLQRIKQPIPDAELYRPYYSAWNYSPWCADSFVEEYRQIAAYTLADKDCCYVLATLVNQALRLDGEVWECGVYRGGTATLLANRVLPASKALRLFDTFEGMPETDPANDLHKAGDFSDTSFESVQARVAGPLIHLHKGFIPTTFAGLESSKISFAHVDVDIRSAILDCCAFIFPRLCIGGFIVFDDYGRPSCPGARSAVDEFFVGTGLTPLVLPTGQAIIFKSIM